MLLFLSSLFLPAPPSVYLFLINHTSPFAYTHPAGCTFIFLQEVSRQLLPCSKSSPNLKVIPAPAHLTFVNHGIMLMIIS